MVQYECTIAGFVHRKSCEASPITSVTPYVRTHKHLVAHCVKAMLRSLILDKFSLLPGGNSLFLRKNSLFTGVGNFPVTL